MTVSAKLGRLQVADAGEPAGREDVDLEDLVAHDVEPDHEQAVLHEFRTHHIGDGEHLLGYGHLLGLPLHVHVRAQLALGGDAAERRELAVTLEGDAVHHEEAHVARRRRGDVALGDQVPLLGDRLDDLVEVGVLGDSILKTFLPPEPCSGLTTAPSGWSSMKARISSMLLEISVDGGRPPESSWK